MRPVILSILSVLAIAALLGGCAGTGGWNKIDTPNDPNYLFATGNAESQDLQLAIDKATLNARAEIGRMLELKINGLQKSFAEEAKIKSFHHPIINSYAEDAVKNCTDKI